VTYREFMKCGSMHTRRYTKPDPLNSHPGMHWTSIHVSSSRCVSLSMSWSLNSSRQTRCYRMPSEPSLWATQTVGMCEKTAISFLCYISFFTLFFLTLRTY